VVLQDICHAFDLVDWEMACQAMVRLKLLDEYIQLYASLASQKSNQVITPFGLTDPYIAESGLDQGAVEAPIHWRISYDPLLYAIDTLAAGYTVSVPWKGPKPPALDSESSITVSSLAYVDDTVWLARSKLQAQRMLSLAMEFFHLNDIAINVKKTVLMVINPSSDPLADPLQFGMPALPLIPIHKSEGTRYLGCHVSADGTLVAQKYLIDELVTGFVNQLMPKQITDFQAVYLINHILVPTILACCILMVPSYQECLKWTRQYLNLVKQKSRLPKDTPNVMLFHPRLYKLTNLYDAVGEMHISELWLQLNSPVSSLAGSLTCLQLLSLHRQCMTAETPVSRPTSETSRYWTNLIARVLPIMAERGIQFNVPSGWSTVARGQVGISSLFNNWVEFRPMQAGLRHHGLFTLEQLLSPDCKILLTWKELRNHMPSLSGAVPEWFTKIEAVLGLGAHSTYKRYILLPPLVHPVIPNPYYTSTLPYSPIAAPLGAFVVVF